MSLTQGSGAVKKIEQILDLRVISLPEGSIHVESHKDRIVLNTVKDMGLNLVAVLLHNLHVLHQGVPYELKIREQRVLTVISEFKVNN